MGRFKVEVGQVFSNCIGNEYTISKVDCLARKCYYVNNIESEFGAITIDGYSDDWDEGIILVQNEPEKPTTSKREEAGLLAFFARPQAGNCACGLLKEQCDYHR